MKNKQSKPFKYLFTCLLLSALLFSKPLKAQHHLTLKTDIPVQYALQYKFQPINQFSIYGQVGALAFPYDKILVELMRIYGGNEDLLNIIDRSYKLGGVFEYGFQFHFSRKSKSHFNNYVSLYFMHLYLQAEETPRNLIRDLYNVDFPFSPVIAQTQIELQSRIHQIGLKYGRIIPFKNERIALITEIGITANIGSNHHLEIGNETYRELENYTNTELKRLLKKYAFLPSVNVGIQFRLGKAKEE